VDLNALQARIYVLEKEAGSLEKGKPVTIKLDALPDREFHGDVRSVSALAATLERNSPLKYFTCDVTIRDAGEYLRHIKPGMALQARVILEKYDSCFVVPASALDIRDTDSNVYVYVKTGDSGDAKRDYQKRIVEIGMAKHGQATILKGVKEGELVALRNPIETRALKLPDFTKATNLNQQRRGGPGGQQDLMRMMQMQMDRGGGGGMRGGGGRRSDIALKHDIALLGYLDSGIGFYRFAYNGSDTAYVGVMAQEVERVRPDAVVRGDDGYLRVFYDKLGLTFQTYDQWLAVGARVPSTAHGHR
jgi:hypothetical protein